MSRLTIFTNSSTGKIEMKIWCFFKIVLKLRTSTPTNGKVSLMKSLKIKRNKKKESNEKLRNKQMKLRNKH